jgi:murein DD-endopeptidase MepM/ murein hydrolase activator NlpD
LTQESLAISPRATDWVDQTFLWTASSLTLMAIVATLSSASKWPTDPSLGLRRLTPPPAPAPQRPAAPAPFIAFGDPVPGYPVISPFGLRQLPWEEAGRLHKGVDIAAPMGAQVLAAADGVIVRTGTDPGYGRFIEMAHKGGMGTLYGHLSAVLAQPGMAVRLGQPIGLIGSTGSSTGAHLHFEIHDPDGRALNPEMFMGQRFASLADLPLKAAARLPHGPVRIAFVSYIPPARQAEMLAREEAKQDEIAPVVQPTSAPMAVAPVPHVALAATGGSSVIHFEGRGPDGRIHAVITQGG